MERSIKYRVLIKCITAFLQALVLAGILTVKAGEGAGSCTAGISPEECLLNGGREVMPISSYWGQDNVGIISLNTFRTAYVGINRYDWQGNLIEEPVGGSLLRSVRNGEDGYITSAYSDSDRGCASVSIELRKDKTLDVNAAARYLCAGCLKNIIEKERETDLYGVGVIDFKTREIYVLDQRAADFQFGDFYFSYYILEEYGIDRGEGIRMVVFYCPRRYG